MVDDAGMLMGDLKYWIPKEYQHAFQRISSIQLRYFTRKLKEKSLTENIDRRALLDVIVDTLENLMSPSPWWWYLLGKIALETSNFEVLLRFIEKRVNGTKMILSLFYYRRKELSLSLDEFLENWSEFQSDLESTVDELLVQLLQEEFYFTLGYRGFLDQDVEQVQEARKNLHDFIEGLGGHVTSEIPREMLKEMKFHLLILDSCQLLLEDRYDEASEILSQNQSLVEAIDNPWLKALLGELMGALHERQENIESLLKTLHSTFEDYTHSGNYPEAAEVGVRLTKLFLQKGDLKTSQELSLRVLEMLHQLEKYEEQALLHITLAKAFLDHDELSLARKHVIQVENLIAEKNLRNVKLHVLTGYLHMQLSQDMEIVDLLRRVEKLEGIHSPWGELAKAITCLIQGNLDDAESSLRNAQYLAELQHDVSLDLELSYFMIEFYFKRYLLDADEQILRDIRTLFTVIEAILKSREYGYLHSLFHLFLFYLHISLKQVDEALRSLSLAQESSSRLSHPRILNEVALAEQRMKYLREVVELLSTVSDKDEIITRKSPWIAENSIVVLSVIEAMRILRHLQMYQFTIGDPYQEEPSKPYLLLIIRTSDGIPLFTYDFGSEQFDSDQDMLIGGILAVIADMAEQVFGVGNINLIEQENHVIFLNPLKKSLVLVLITPKDSYLTRKRLQIVRKRIIENELDDFLDSVLLINEENPNWKKLQDIVKETFES